MDPAQPGPGEELNTGAVTTPRLATSVIVLRGEDRGLEVLLVQRNPASRFMGGAPHRVLTRDQILDLSRLHNDEVYNRAVDLQIMRVRPSHPESYEPRARDRCRRPAG